MHKEISILAIFSTIFYMLSVFWSGGLTYSRLILPTIFISALVMILIPVSGFFEMVFVFSYLMTFLFLSRGGMVKYYSFIFILIFSAIFFENLFGINYFYLIPAGILCLLFSLVFFIKNERRGGFLKIVEFLDCHVIRDIVFYFILFSLSMIIRIHSGRI